MKRVLLALGATVLLACGCRSESVDAVASSGTPLAVVSLPEIAMPSTRASPVSFSGPVHVINVWASWCEPCRRELPSLEALSRSLDQRSVRVVGINIDEDRELALEYLRAHPSGFGQYWDPGMHEVARHWGLIGVPVTLLVDSSGRVRGRIAGARDWNSPAMRRIISSLLPPPA